MNNDYSLKRNTFLVSLIIGLHFLWSGSSYLSWLYNLLDIIEVNHISANADIISEGIAYLFQTVGILSACIFIKKTGMEFSKSSNIFILISVIHLILIFPSIIADSYYPVLCIGLFTNILIGFETGYYLIMITELLPGNRRGFAFGLGYSIGSVGSWILSLIGEGNFLKSNYSICVYVFFLLIIVGIFHLIDTNTFIDSSAQAKELDKKLIAVTGVAILMLCIVKGIGFYFPLADITTGNASLELSRAFYAIGLLLAGIINDYKRQFGAFACIAALAFPFILLCLTFSPTYSFYLWILGYVFTGFYAVYRVIVFSDIADRTPNGLFLAPLGLMFGRLGDALGAIIGVSLSDTRTVLVFTGAGFFIITIIVCFFAFLKLYVTVPAATKEHSMSAEEKLANYTIYHDLSVREKEVLPLIIEGLTNSEISNILFVSENTIKFHVKNILKKTGCSNRRELLRNYSEYH